MAPFYCYSLLLLLGLVSQAVATELSPDFYSCSCPMLLPIVKIGVAEAIQKEARMGASLLRLHFHDCFVNGCDASILLDDTGNFIGEKTANANNNSVRGFNVIDDLKAEVEKTCPGVVSCADILTLAARDSVVLLGGPYWEVPLGRRDSTTASRLAANKSIPAPFFNLTNLISNFANHGLSVKDLVALSGGHTIGLARCVQFRAHIYNDSDIDASFAKSLQSKCPRSGNDDVLAPLDFQTPTHFDNLYFNHLLVQKGLLHSDQELFRGSSSTDKWVTEYASDTDAFFNDFANAMIRMSKIKPLTGTKGQIRINCRKVN